jgi:serine/threonine protein phosphatase PrpC
MDKQFEIDAVSYKGNGHEINQDYCLYENINGSPLLVVADGCSGKNQIQRNYSELGSQLLSHIVKSLFLEGKSFDSDIFVNLIKLRLEYFSQILNLNIESFFSTLLFAFQDQNEIVTRMYGDGNLIGIDVNNKIDIVNVEYLENMPYYIVYNNEENYIEELKKRDPNSDPKKCKIIKDFSIKNNEIIENKIENYGFDNFIEKRFSLEKYKMVCLATDGFSSFKKNVDFLSLEKTIPYFLNFKNFKGKFVQRRAKNAINELQKEGYSNIDDVTYGVINKV